MLCSKDASFGYLVESFPRLLLLSVESHLKPMMKFLEDVGVERGSMRNVLLLYPPIIFYEIEKDMKQRLRAFKKVTMLIWENKCLNLTSFATISATL